MDARKIARAAQSSPATFIAFDLIERGSQPLTERKNVLAGTLHPIEAVQQVESFPGTSGSTLLSAAASRDMEGIVGKRLDSLYRLNHRSTDWVKVKCWKEQEVTILGLRPVGALVGEAGGQVLCVVELGWTPTDRRVLYQLIPGLKEHTSGDVTWLKPLLRARMRYRVTPSGQLREPVWGGFVLAA